MITGWQFLEDGGFLKILDFGEDGSSGLLLRCERNYFCGKERGMWQL
jgi:hypothetical protein